MNHSNIYKELKARNKRKKIEKQAIKLAPFFLGLILGASITLLILNQVIVKII